MKIVGKINYKVLGKDINKTVVVDENNSGKLNKFITYFFKGLNLISVIFGTKVTLINIEVVEDGIRDNNKTEE